jgi:2-polyprenyl-3-methyl-5-hydroxy-6-metoxy-1,4-benzoquinol methylase
MRGSNDMRTSFVDRAILAAYRNWHSDYSDSYTFDEWTWSRFGLSLHALTQRWRDFTSVSLCRNSRLRTLHTVIRSCLRENRSWTGYDYGLGYLYQSFPRLGLSGRRDTAARLASMSLIDRTRNHSVLDIGCNTGFLSLELATTCKQIHGFDINPHLIAIANHCSHFLQVKNARFTVSSFYDFPENEKFDIVLSLSNHITFDSPIYPTFDGYLQKCGRLLDKTGHIIFESHTAAFEYRGGGIRGLLPKLREQFAEVHHSRTQKGTPLDRDRILFVGKLR